MSNLKNIHNISDIKPFRSLDENVAKNVELSKIHTGKSSDHYSSSHDSQKHTNSSQLKHSESPNNANTQFPGDNDLVEKYETLSMKAQFSVENEVFPSDASRKNIVCDNVESFSNSNTDGAQVDLIKTRTSNDTCIDITPAAATLIPDIAEDDAAASRRFNNNDQNYTSQISSIALSEETPILFASKTDAEIMTDVTLEEDCNTTRNEIRNVANETTLRQIKRKKSNAYPMELKKTGVALLFMVLNFCATTISLALTHERTPDKEPLPDFLLDNVQNRVWGLTASEIVLQVNVISAMIVLVMHKHRFIILRRLALILGLLYGYRAITMFVTNLPKADPNYFCAAKAKDGITLYEVLSRAFSILSGFGLSMNGKHYYCGDYIYSGHTMTIILAHLLIQEYTSKRLWLLHWLTFILAILGIAFLVVGRGHYTIDIIIAYWLTTRLWWIYHSMASFDALQSTSANSNGTVVNHFVKVWWWPLFRWFECNVRSGPLPNGFNLPLPTVCFKVCIRIRKSRSRTTPIFPGAGSTDTAINAASFLVNNLSSLTGNISGSSRSSNTKFARTGRTSNSKSGNKGRTSKNSNSNSVGSLMTLISHKQAEQ